MFDDVFVFKAASINIFLITMVSNDTCCPQVDKTKQKISLKQVLYVASCQTVHGAYA